MNININYNFNYNKPVFTSKYISIPKSELTEYVNQGKTAAEIANIYGMSISWCKKILKKHGLKINKRGNKKDVNELIAKSYAKGVTIQELAGKAGVSVNRIYSWIHQQTGINISELKRKISSKKPIETANNIDAAQMEKYAKQNSDIIERFQAGESIEAICRKFNVKEARVYAAIYSLDRTNRNELIKKKLQENKHKQIIGLSAKFWEEKIQEFINQIQTGKNLSELLKNVGYNYKTKFRTIYYKYMAELKRKNKRQIEKEALEKIKQGLSINQIAKEFRISPITVYNSIPEEKFETAKNIWKAKRKDVIIEKINQGMSISAIAREIGCSIYTIYHHLGLNNATHYIETRKNDRKNIITKLLKEGTDIKEIALKLNLSICTIKRYIKEIELQ